MFHKPALDHVLTPSTYHIQLQPYSSEYNSPYTYIFMYLYRVSKYIKVYIFCIVYIHIFLKTYNICIIVSMFQYKNFFFFYVLTYNKHFWRLTHTIITSVNFKYFNTIITCVFIYLYLSKPICPTLWFECLASTEHPFKFFNNFFVGLLHPYSTK